MTTLAAAQSREVVPLSPRVGMTLDAEENLFYGVFPEIKGFESAQFYETGNNTFLVRIVFVEYSHQRTSRKSLTLMEFIHLQNRVNSQPEITKEDRENIHKNLTYLETEAVLTNIPSDQYVVVRHRDGSRIRGTLISFDGKWLEIQTPVMVQSIPVWDLNRIAYRQEIRERTSWKPVMYTLSAVIGLGLAEIWNLQKESRAEMIWHYRFLGTVLGLLSGAEVYNSFNIVSTPKRMYSLTPDEMEQLKGD